MADSAAYLSAVAALVGTFVGGVTSIATSWLGQQRQTKERRKAQQKVELQDLYRQFHSRCLEIVCRRPRAQHDANCEAGRRVCIAAKYSCLCRLGVIFDPRGRKRHVPVCPLRPESDLHKSRCDPPLRANALNRCAIACGAAGREHCPQEEIVDSGRGHLS